jgi:hypothetical protein
MNRTERESESAPPHRKPYGRPKLIPYGHVKDIVQGGGSKNNDAGNHNATKPCWIAEALYGADAPRTLLLRAWLSQAYDQRRSGWWLISLYAKFGRRVADLVRCGRIPPRMLLPLFNSLLVKANDDIACKLKRNR